MLASKFYGQGSSSLSIETKTLHINAEFTSIRLDVFIEEMLLQWDIYNSTNYRKIVFRKASLSQTSWRYLDDYGRSGTLPNDMLMQFGTKPRFHLK